LTGVVARRFTDGILRQATVERLSKHEYAITAPDSTAAMMEALSDEFSRRILGCAIKKGRTIGEIYVEQGIPPSTCYKRIKRLVESGVMVVERMIVPPTGKKYAVYRSTFSRLYVGWENGQLAARVTVNPEVAEKLENAWLAMLRKKSEGKVSPGALPK